MGETGKVGSWLLLSGCTDTEISPRMEKGFLKVLEDHTAWQMSPSLLLSEPSVSALLLTTATTLSKIGTGGMTNAVLNSQLPAAEIGRPELMFGRGKSQYKFQMLFQEKVFLA